MELSDLTPAERFAYEWQYDMLGGFMAHLAETISRADDGNRARLALGFPHEVQGIVSYQEVPGWWEAVEAKANSQPPPTRSAT